MQQDRIQGRRFQRSAWALALSSLVVVSGCAAPNNRPESPLEFPPPPAKARLRYVQWIETPADLEIGASLFDLFSGEEARFSRPYAVVANSGYPLLVADPGLGVIHVLDAEDDSYRVIDKVGTEPLRTPVALARDPLGNIYVADSTSGRVHCLTPKGDARWSDDHAERPVGLALDPRRRRLYVSDAAAHAIRVYDLDGKVIAVWGHRGSGPGEFNFPTHLAVDTLGRLYVSDTLNFRVQILSPKGVPVSTLGRAGDTTGSMARPKGVAIDSQGHIYVVDALFDAVQVFDTNGQFLLSFGAPGDDFAEFSLPSGLWIDAEDRLYVADSYNQRVHVFQYLPQRGDP